ATPASAQRAYRIAVRSALLNGRISSAEEEQLAQLAEELGLGAALALRLRREEERAPPMATET
ncbi:MAG TPA: hypothetical protein VHH36_05295, partial [Candidatus Thermoplasmatota archaeon]|nr:hypothetical protein [Candidatus Thermoplasmatota archaeon]